MKQVTLHDVAEVVGVSTRTVSRVVNDEGGFSEDTRQRVRDAIASLGYRPNLLARGLITRRSGTLGLVGTDMADPFFSELAQSIEQAAYDVGLTMFFASSGADAERQAAVLETFWSHAVDGVILFPAAGTSSALRDFAKRGTTTVVIDDDPIGAPVLGVSSDIAIGAERAVSHLRATGRKHISMLASEMSPPSRRWRERGYRAGLAADAKSHIVRAAPTISGGEIAMQNALRSGRDIDGVFAYNDLMAIGALRCLSRRGVAVPDAIGIVGFDDLAISAATTPALTTIRIDRERLGQEAVRCLLDPDGPPTRPLPVDLVVRASA